MPCKPIKRETKKETEDNIKMDLKKTGSEGGSVQLNNGNVQWQLKPVLVCYVPSADDAVSSQTASATHTGRGRHAQ